jgi:predicted ATP-binding protein involved in virulence
MLKHIKIKGLFGKFNYEIELKEEGLTIITGPNGYGKTTLLKIIHAFSMKNFFFFFRLPFQEIILIDSNEEKVTLKKYSKNNNIIEMASSGDKPTHLKKNDFIRKEKISRLFYPAYSPIDEDQTEWFSIKTGSRITIDKLIENYPEIVLKHSLIEKYTETFKWFPSVYLIREQRLIKKVSEKRKNLRYYDDDEIRESLSNTIEEYARELSVEMKETLAQASKKGQELDSSFPRRLFDEQNQVAEKEFNERYDRVKEKQKLLSVYGLSSVDEDNHTSFRKENAKALLVYLNDTEKKLKVFDDISKKIEVFSSVLNKREFVFKKLEISPDFGFRFITEEGNTLSLTDLSSGEQQEVVLLYELLFRVTPDSLVLLDEPEISLHVAWQKEVLNDLLEIINIRKIKIITATHSPQIIGGHWDLVVDLWDISKENTE